MLRGPLIPVASLRAGIVAVMDAFQYYLASILLLILQQSLWN